MDNSSGNGAVVAIVAIVAIIIIIFFVMQSKKADTDNGTGGINVSVGGGAPENNGN